MNLGQYFANVGKRATVAQADGLAALVSIVDVRSAYGRVRYVVTQSDTLPDGFATGATFTVDADRVRVIG